MVETLDEEDFLEELKLCFVSGHLSSEAYAQLKAIIKQHLSSPKIDKDALKAWMRTQRTG